MFETYRISDLNFCTCLEQYSFPANFAKDFEKQRVNHNTAQHTNLVFPTISPTRLTLVRHPRPLRQQIIHTSTLLRPENHPHWHVTHVSTPPPLAVTHVSTLPTLARKPHQHITHANHAQHATQDSRCCKHMQYSHVLVCYRKQCN